MVILRTINRGTRTRSTTQIVRMYSVNYTEYYIINIPYAYFMRYWLVWFSQEHYDRMVSNIPTNEDGLDAKHDTLALIAISAYLKKKKKKNLRPSSFAHRN